MFNELMDKLKDMIETQKEIIVLTKANMDFKVKVSKLEQELIAAKKRHIAEVKDQNSNLKNMSHILEDILQSQGQSRGTALLNASFAMGDAERIGKVVKAWSNYNSDDEATPRKSTHTTKQEVKGTKATKIRLDTRGSTAAQWVEWESEACSGNKATQSSDSKSSAKNAS